MSCGSTHIATPLQLRKGHVSDQGKRDLRCWVLLLLLLVVVVVPIAIWVACVVLFLLPFLVLFVRSIKLVVAECIGSINEVLWVLSGVQRELRVQATTCKTFISPLQTKRVAGKTAAAAAASD